jgi:hypothetical protein
LGILETEETRISQTQWNGTQIPGKIRNRGEQPESMEWNKPSNFQEGSLIGPPPNSIGRAMGH